jgi:hypothetical protein
MVSESVHVEQPRSREQESEHVAECHRHQYGVGGSPHVSPAQDDDYQGVGYGRRGQQEGRYVAVHRSGVVYGQFAGDVQEVVIGFAHLHSSVVHHGRIEGFCNVGRRRVGQCVRVVVRLAVEAVGPRYVVGLEVVRKRRHAGEHFLFLRDYEFGPLKAYIIDDFLKNSSETFIFVDLVVSAVSNL